MDCTTKALFNLYISRLRVRQGIGCFLEEGGNTNNGSIIPMNQSLFHTFPSLQLQVGLNVSFKELTKRLPKSCAGRVLNT